MSRIRKYQYTATGGERSIVLNDLVGRKLLRVRRDGISKKIRKGAIMTALADNEVFINSLGLLNLSNRIFFVATGQTANRLQPGEKVEVLYV